MTRRAARRRRYASTSATRVVSLTGANGSNENRAAEGTAAMLVTTAGVGMRAETAIETVTERIIEVVTAVVVSGVRGVSGMVGIRADTAVLVLVVTVVTVVVGTAAGSVMLVSLGSARTVPPDLR
jgi:uncharacterized MAPEG superfamily protein